MSQSSRPFIAALSAALARSGRQRAEIASGALVTPRSLQRWIRGDVTPSIAEWSRVLELCGAPPATSLLVAAAGRADLIGTRTQTYLDNLFKHLMAVSADADDRDAAPDPRGARRDAELIMHRWQETNRRRANFIETEFGQDAAGNLDRPQIR